MKREVNNLNRYLFILALFLVSSISEATLAVSLVAISLLFCITEGSDGAVKSLILITARTTISSGFGPTTDDIAMFKWVLLFALSLFIFIGKTNRTAGYSLFLRAILPLTLLFTVFSLISSSYPTVSIFKLISWVFIFSAVVYGVYDSQRVDWMGFLLLVIGTILVVSLFTLPFPVGYLRNGRGFQGITNHPNLFGLLCAIFFGTALSYQWKYPKLKAILLGLCIVESLLSKSRTGVFSIVIFILLYLFNMDLILRDKLILTLLLSIVLSIVFLIIYVNDPNKEGSFWQFVFKGNEDDMLYSRTGQIDQFLEDFSYSPMIGNGFMTPLEVGTRSWTLSFSLIVEAGNLGLALLSQTGIIGFLAFLGSFVYLFFLSPRNLRIAYLIPFVISMGEMVFFSSNNIAIFCYVLFGVCFQPAKTGKLSIGDQHEKDPVPDQHPLPLSR